MNPNRTWIAVADGAQARILLYTARLIGLQQLPDGEFHDPHLPIHNLMTHRQPGVQESAGPARHAVDIRIDPHEQRKEQFLARHVAHLERAEQPGEFEHHVVVSPATALGGLRKEFSQSLKKRIFAEFKPDYVHQPNDYVCQHT